MTIEMRVPDATCGHCKATIETAVTGISGVKTAELDLDSKVLTVAHEENLDPAQVKTAVTEAGYTPA